jgi:RimJ/RimL family protein N-acetyltransferase
MVLLESAPTITGKHVILRAPRDSDKADRLLCPRSAEAVRMYGGDFRSLKPVTVEEVEHWYEWHSSHPLRWMVKAEGRCIGNARLNILNEHARHARYAIGFFGPTAWGHGYGTEATRLVLRHAFHSLGLHRVDLVVLEYNHRAIACYRKCGFVQEGVARDSALVAGEWHNDVMMSILEDEYRALLPSWDLPPLHEDLEDRRTSGST